MKQVILFVACLMLVISFANAAGNNKTFALRIGDAATQVISVTYANSQVDTLKLAREAGVATYSLSMSFADSASLTKIIMVRVINGVQQDTLAGDSVMSTFACTAAESKTISWTVAPLPEQYWFFVTYAGSANGVTSPTVRYSVQRIYSK